VSCGWRGGRIQLRFIFDGPIAEDDEEDMRIVTAEVIADFPEPWRIEEEIIRLDFPEDLRAHCLETWAYRRKEKPLG